MHRVYFEARRGHLNHEKRWAAPGVIGVASWKRDRIVGLRVADQSASGSFETKSFRAEGTRLVVDADTHHRCSKLVVDVLSQDGMLLFPEYRAVTISGQNGRFEAQWVQGDGDARGLSSVVGAGSAIRLRFTLYGRARVFSFRVHP